MRDLLTWCPLAKAGTSRVYRAPRRKARLVGARVPWYQSVAGDRDLVTATRPITAILWDFATSRCLILLHVLEPKACVHSRCWTRHKVCVGWICSLLLRREAVLGQSQRSRSPAGDFAEGSSA